MKKFHFAIAALTGALAFTSCSNDELAAPASEGNVTFTVAVPGKLQSRAFADGTTAQQNVCYYVYDQAQADAPVLTGTVPMSNLKGTLTLSLATSHTYDVVFLATATESPYTYDEAARTMSVDYSTAATSDEALDAFYATVKDLAVTGPSNQSVKLYRPFAQLNIGTDDKAEYEAVTNTSISTSSVTVTGLYSAFDLMTEDVTGETTDVTFLPAALPGAGETFPVKYTNSEGEEVAYTYLSMDYLLVNQTKDLVEVTLNIENEDGSAEVREYSNIPVQRNYRTNIYGTLLTASTLFNVEIIPGFNEPDYDIETGIAAPKQDESGVYLITTQAELAWIAEKVNGGDRLSTSTFSLQNDINLVGEWTPIGIPEFGTRFGGKFLGNGHTIYNLNVNCNARAGFFGFFNGQVEDLNFDNATVKSNHWAGVVAGYSDNETGSCYIKNCKVTNSSVILEAELVDGEWDNGDKGGLIIGYMASSDQVENCTVENCTLQGYRDLGGIIGYSNKSVIRNNSVDGLTITVDNAHNYKNYTTLGKGGNDANPVIGEANGGTDEGNTSANVTIAALINSQEELDAAMLSVADGENSFFLADGEYIVNTINNGNAIVNINGSRNVVLTTKTSRNAAHTLNINGVTINGGGNYTGFQHTGNTTSFTDCQINNFFLGYSPNLIFRNCTFNTKEYALYTYAATNVELTDCTFTNTSAGKAVLVYNEDPQYTGCDITVTNCTFTAPKFTLSSKGAIEIHTEQWTNKPQGTVRISNSSYTGAFLGMVYECNNNTNQPTNFFTVEEI